MKENRVEISGYKGVWLFTMFDLPVDDKEKRKMYTAFRKDLLAQGFSMLQYSVYARYFNGQEAADAHIRRIRWMVPSEGEVRLMYVTDKQFGDMEVYYGKKRRAAEKAPEQMLLF